MKTWLAGILVALLALAAQAAPLTAREIIARAHAAAGGEAWLHAGTNVMRGHATLCRDGRPEACVTADRYEMYRVYPTELKQAHAVDRTRRAGDRNDQSVSPHRSVVLHHVSL